MNPFEAIQYVGTPLSLIAFAIAVGAWVYRLRLGDRRKLIETAPEKDRARLLDATINEFGRVRPETLTPEQRYALAMRLIEDRAARFRMMMLGGGFAAVLIAALVIAIHVIDMDPYMSLTVRMQEPGGAAVGGGLLTLDAGSGRTTHRVGADGQVRFDNVPRKAFAGGVRLYPDFTGYGSEPALLDSPPAGDVYYFELQRQATALSGAVVDPSGTPAANVVMLFDAGAVVDTTDALGRFSVNVPQRPGDHVPLRMLRDGVVGFNDAVVVPVGETLTLRFDPRR